MLGDGVLGGGGGGAEVAGDIEKVMGGAFAGVVLFEVEFENGEVLAVDLVGDGLGFDVFDPGVDVGECLGCSYDELG